jgi:hypothetical protein
VPDDDFFPIRDRDAQCGLLFYSSAVQRSVRSGGCLCFPLLRGISVDGFSLLQGGDWAQAIQMMEYVAPVQKVPFPQSHNPTGEPKQASELKRHLLNNSIDCS